MEIGEKMCPLFVFYHIWSRFDFELWSFDLKL